MFKKLPIKDSEENLDVVKKIMQLVFMQGQMLPNMLPNMQLISVDLDLKLLINALLKINKISSAPFNSLPHEESYRKFQKMHQSCNDDAYCQDMQALVDHINHKYLTYYSIVYSMRHASIKRMLLDFGTLGHKLQVLSLYFPCDYKKKYTKLLLIRMLARLDYGHIFYIEVMNALLSIKYQCRSSQDFFQYTKNIFVWLTSSYVLQTLKQLSALYCVSDFVKDVALLQGTERIPQLNRHKELKHKIQYNVEMQIIHDLMSKFFHIMLEIHKEALKLPRNLQIKNLNNFIAISMHMVLGCRLRAADISAYCFHHILEHEQKQFLLASAGLGV